MRSVMLVSAVTAVAAMLVSGCCRKSSSSDNETPSVSAAPAASSPAPASSVAGPAVPFAGSYRKHAESLHKDGRKVSSPTTKGSAKLVVEPGKVIYSQTYPESGRDVTVTQTYSFTASDVVRHGTGYDVKLTFVNMESDTKNYSPDKHQPKLDVVKSAKGWEIGLMTKDEHGVMAGSEFDPM